MRRSGRSSGSSRIGDGRQLAPCCSGVATVSVLRRSQICQSAACCRCLQTNLRSPSAHSRSVQTCSGSSTFLLLTDDDVRVALPMARAVEVNRQAFIDMHSGRAVVPSRHMLPIERYEGFTLFKPAYIPVADLTSASMGLPLDGGALGLKASSVYQ